MNNMQKIAKMLNIELNEPFMIKDMSSTFTLTEKGLFDKNKTHCPHILTALLTGVRTAYALNWIPEHGEVYYHVALGNKVWSGEWVNAPIDILRLGIGNVFRTKEKAAAEKERIGNIYKQIRDQKAVLTLTPMEEPNNGKDKNGNT